MTKKMVGSYPVPNCHPNGLALGPNQEVLLGYDGHPLIIGAMNGHVEATIGQVNACDKVWYNPGDHRYYLAAFTNASGSVLSILDADARTWIANLPTAPKAHLAAVDAQNNHIFVPLSGQGIAVYARVYG